MECKWRWAEVALALDVERYNIIGAGPTTWFTHVTSAGRR